MISPEERHKYGQFYTRAEVVDLINSFCIRTGEETIMDPACGGGTFLVRAYARKRELQPSRSHERMLGELYGVDISPFACHLTTINLATRDLIEDENYPRIARSDFFDVQTKKRFISLPSHVKSRGLGKIQHREIEIPSLDAIVGNPPYVRQEDIKSDRGKKNNKREPSRGTKEFYRSLVKKEMAADFSGRSDLHCYFWPHAATFLKPNGWLCLLTSSQWLDVEYGFKLQGWILERFKIVALFESWDEPWFVGARVVTTATILQRCDSAEERAANTVRFVQLRRPIADILASDGTTAGAIQAADEFRAEILRLTENTSNERYRARLIPQKKLFDDGVQLGRLMRGEGEDDEVDDIDVDADFPTGGYYGGKWGIYLRAPDLWFDIIDRFGNRFAPLGDMAGIKRGVTSGKDEFFYPRDCTQDCLDRVTEPVAFQHDFGVSRGLVETGEVKLVRCGAGAGEIMAIEAKYLEPEVHSLLEIKGYSVSPANCARMILLIDKSKGDLKGSYVLKYINWGESKGWHKNPTCNARQTEKRFWYDLTSYQRALLILPKIQQYRLLTIANPLALQLNCSLMGIFGLANDKANLLGAILNSTVSLLSRILYARVLGNEGNIQLDVYAAKMMLVPCLPTNSERVVQRAVQCFDRLKQREVFQMLSERRMRRMALTNAGRESQLAGLSELCELDMLDRRELDDAVFEMLGVRDRRDRDTLIENLYAYLREFFEQVRQKEEKAIVNKNTSKRKSASLSELAGQVLAELNDKYGYLLRPYSDFVDLSKPFSTYDLPTDGAAELHHDLFADQGSVRFAKGRKPLALITTKTPEQAELIVLIAEHGVRGLVRIPLKSEDCQALNKNYARFIEDRAQRIRQIVAERTGDPDLQDDIFETVDSLIAYSN